jgi:hypothetical protein
MKPSSETSEFQADATQEHLLMPTVGVAAAKSTK